MRKKDAEIRLKQINIFFTAYGTFISGLFCILQYFFNSYKKIFAIISFVFLLLVFFITYYISYSKKFSQKESFWKYINKCSDDVGILNPIMLSISFILSFTQEKVWLFFCIILMALHMYIYIIDVKHIKSSSEK